MMSLRVLLAAFLIVLAVPAAHAAPKADLWEKWTKHDPKSTQSVDHSAWDAFLKKYLRDHEDGVVRVAYKDVSEADRKSLADYIKSLEKTNVSGLSRKEQLPYWINLYNALTVRVIIDNLPVKSILDISGGLFSKGPWKDELLEIEGEDLTLDDIEHRILRPIWNEPLVHYAVNCASIGCPSLQQDAFTAKNTQALFKEAAEEFINHPRGARVEDGKLYVSSIFSWFEEDFGGSDKGVIEHLKLYAKPDLKKKLANIDDIADDSYDWNLNGTK